MTSQEWAAWVAAMATVVLVGITGFYAWSTHNLLRETRRQVNLALGLDARSIAARRRKLLLIGRRIDDLLSSIESSEKPRETLLWTEEEFSQFEALLPEFEGLHVNDTSTLLGLLTKIRHHLPATPGPSGLSDNPAMYDVVSGPAELFQMVRDAQGKLFSVLDSVETEIRRESALHRN